jgi:hypothetical protein
MERVADGRCRCRCDCGRDAVVKLNSLRTGYTRSCGCLLSSELRSLRASTHRMSKTRLYWVWVAAKRRCHSQRDKSWPIYGGRGISVCAEWMSDFTAFYDWALANGYKNGLTIERINNDGNYEPRNCRWATPTEQANNKRTNRLLTAFGETKPTSLWAQDARCKTSGDNLRQRIDIREWAPEKAISTPTRPTKKRHKHTQP